MAVAHLEGDGNLPGWEPAQWRDPELDHEPALRSEVPGGVAEALNLLLLAAKVRDGVPHQVHQSETAGNHSGRHVSDHDRDRALVHLASQLSDHRLGQL